MLASSEPGCPAGLRSHPSNLIRFRRGRVRVVPTLSHDRDVRFGRRAGIQADLKAFAARAAHGTAVVALTAQNTVAVNGVARLPPAFVLAQLEAVFDDIGSTRRRPGCSSRRS